MQRASRLLKSIRGTYLFRKSAKWLISIERIQRLVRSIAATLPIALKLAVLVFMVTYSYSILAMEIFHSDYQIHEKSQFMPKQYTSFDTIGDALLSFFHIINGST